MGITKREWRILKRELAYQIMEDDTLIATVHSNESTLANAHLIAAAPKQNEALKVAQAFITEGTKPQREKALVIITEALAKAGGK